MDFEPDDHGYCLVATARLPSWRGYRDCTGAYASAGGSASSDGSVTIVFAPEGRDISPLGADEKRLVQWFLDNEPAVSAAVQDAVLREYPALQAHYDYPAAEQAEIMPDIASTGGLRALIGLSAVYVHQIDKDGLPYLGFEFGCTWDAEHGLGMLMHGLRPVEVGGADTAMTLWIARKDAGLA